MVFGPDVPHVQGKGTVEKSAKIEEYFYGVKENECVLEIDIMNTGPEHTLVGVVVRNHNEDSIGYTVSVTLGLMRVQMDSWTTHFCKNLSVY